MLGLLNAFRSFFGAAVHNALMPPTPRIHLRLRFVDPLGVVRDFPPNYPLNVRFGDGVGSVSLSPPVQPGGLVVFDGRTVAPWQFFTLEFPASEIPYIVCEALDSPPASPPQFALASALSGATNARQRFFSLPSRWELKQADWSPPTFAGNGRFDSPPGRIYHTLSPPADISMGTPANPVPLILIPHWHFARFEYYDRYFGNAHLDSPPRPAHRQRISIPQIAVEGFRNDVNAAGSPPDTHSNWAIDLGAKSLLQAIPFMLRRDATGAALSPPDGTRLGLRLRTAANTVVYSQTDQQRVIAVSPPPAAPGPDRLRYYDLPQLWKSRGYYTRRVVSSPPAAGKFFHTLTTAEIASAEQRTSPLVFSLDDIVLCVGNPATGAVTAVLSPPADAASSPPSGRVALFNHRFDSSAGIASNAQGVHRMLTPPAPDAFDLPRSNVAPARNYIFDYPDWTRVLTCRGNVHDVFDKRTPDGLSPPGVVGARAAVRWVDATSPLPGIAVSTWSPPPGAAWVPQADGLPIPYRRLSGVPPLVSVPAANPLFAEQPFYQQRTARRYQAAFSAAADEQIGRYDIVMLRCCDVQSGNEVAINFNYLRSSFNFAGPLSPPLAISQPAYAQQISQNVGNRWSGNDPGINSYRANFVPRTSPPLSPPVPLRVDAVWFPQSVTQNRAHFDVVLWNQARDNRGGQRGTGNSGVTSFQSAGGPTFRFAAAHETGHMGGLPDEYNERWNSASYGQISFQQNLPGDPYEADGRNETGAFVGSGMMNSNQTMRNRYFWHAAEWIRQIIGTPLKVVYQDIGGTLYNDYWLPQHANAARSYYPWPLLGRLNQAVSPPAPSPPSPPVAYPQQWGRYDMFLYGVGKDHYSSNLVSGHASVAQPVDAILVIALKITCSLLPRTPSATLANETSIRNQIVQHLAAGVRTTFNPNDATPRWAFSGVFSPPNWTINKGLIYIIPEFVVENHSPPWDATRLPADRMIPIANTIRNTFGVNYQLNVEWISPPASRWSPPGRRLELEMQSVAALDALFATEIPRMLGINKAPGALSPPDLEPIVRLLLPGARVRQLP